MVYLKLVWGGRLRGVGRRLTGREVEGNLQAFEFKMTRGGYLMLILNCVVSIEILKIN